MKFNDWLASVVLFYLKVLLAVAARPEIRCPSETCLFQEGDAMDFLCIHSNGIDANNVTVVINLKEVDVKEKVQIDRFKVRISLVPRLEWDGKQLTCRSANESSGRIFLHVQARPATPEVKSCHWLKHADQSEDSESFQCSWNPQVPENSIIHQLYWSRNNLNDDESPLEWNVCPDQMDGSCTWHSSDNDTQSFFHDEDGSTEGWKNCVVVVANKKMEAANVTVRNYTSDKYCFGMARETTEGMHPAVVAGITLGVVVTVAFIVGVVVFYRRQKKKMSLKIDVPEMRQMEDKRQEDSQYTTVDDGYPHPNWQDSWLSTAATPSTGNSTAPLLNQESRHFTFPNNAHTNYAKSKTPNNKLLLAQSQTAEQADLLKKFFENNNDAGDGDDDDAACKTKDGIHYAVIKTPDAKNKLEDITEDKNSVQSNRSHQIGGPMRSYENDLHPKQEDHVSIEDMEDGMYTINLPQSLDSKCDPGSTPSQPRGNSVTSYTIIAPCSDGKTRNLNDSTDSVEDVKNL